MIDCWLFVFLFIRWLMVCITISTLRNSCQQVK